VATQTELDKLAIAWDRLRKMVNTTLPAQTDKLWSIRNKHTSGGGPRPIPS
jgi:hypothetical protein